MKQSKAIKHTKRHFLFFFMLFVILFGIVMSLYGAIVASSLFMLLLAAYFAILSRLVWSQRDDSITITDDGIEYDIHDGLFTIRHLKGKYKWGDGVCYTQYRELIFSYSNSKKIKIKTIFFPSEMLLDVYVHSRHGR